MIKKLVEKMRPPCLERFIAGALVAGGVAACGLAAMNIRAAEEPKAALITPSANDTHHLSRENSLGMKFLPVPGSTALFSIWETRNQDYLAFRAATGRAWSKPGFDTGPLHPVVNVNWEDAKTFCDWLTAKERREGRLTAKQLYRLPTDREWSAAVGLAAEQGRTPEDRMKTQIIWPWGHYWPPQPGDGNYASELKIDDYAHTSPAGTFKANIHGLYDLGGNVWEWCDDWYNDARVTKVMRGGSFNDGLPAYLLAAYRFNGTMNLSNDDIGFRVVLVNDVQ